MEGGGAVEVVVLRPRKGATKHQAAVREKLGSGEIVASSGRRWPAGQVVAVGVCEEERRL